jgi:hypothetical protein
MNYRLANILLTLFPVSEHRINYRALSLFDSCFIFLVLVC